MENRAIFSNFGPISAEFEQNVNARMFGGTGECLTMCNATVGLMIAIRHVVESERGSRRRYALMPSFTFAAAAQAAMWNRLTPLFCDINPQDWSADRSSEQELLEKYHDQIAVIVPYATFGYSIDLSWYEEVHRRYGIPAIVDAAASLGTLDDAGRGFGAGFSGAIVFSMHVTKSFATAEGGLIYSANKDLIHDLRSMSNFGFGKSRNAVRMGLNGKMSEVSALLASLRLENFDQLMSWRSRLVDLYREALPEFSFQPRHSNRQAHQFTSALLPPELAPCRSAIQEGMRRQGVDSANYFSPHVAQQDYFREYVRQPLPVTDDVASRILTLPLFDSMTEDDVHEVVAALQASLPGARKPAASVPVSQTSAP